MRRKKELMNKLRVNILEDKKMDSPTRRSGINEEHHRQLSLSLPRGRIFLDSARSVEKVTPRNSKNTIRTKNINRATR